MPVDFQLIFPQETIDLSSVVVLPGEPKTVEVIGEDFRAVDEVLINGTQSPSVMVVTKNTLRAQVPDLWKGNDILSVNVVSRRITLSPRSLVKFKIGRRPGKVSGIMRLMQLFLKVLFTTPGTDIFNKQLGAAGLRNIGEVIGVGDGADMLSSLVIAVDTATRQIVAMQARNPSIPLDERLMDAKIVRQGFDKSNLSVILEIELQSQSGQLAITNLEI